MWQSIAVIVVAILIAVFAHRLWLPSLLNTLRGNRIDAVWAGKEYSLTVSEAENVINQQESALLDSKWGPVARLTAIPGVRSVELAPKLVHGLETAGELVFRVVVAKKRPLHEIAAEHEIPVQIGNVRTDVVEG